MASITAIAHDFFAACETGKGWEVCKAYCAHTRPSRLKPNRSQELSLLRNIPTG